MTTNTIPMDAGLRAEGSRDAGMTAGKSGWRTLFRVRLAAVGRMRQRRKAISQLARMSDEALLDLGIPRDRIAEVVDGLIAREGPDARR